MPLMLLGIIVIAAIAAYWFLGGGANSGKDTSREIRERYSDASEKAVDAAKDIGDDVKRAIRKRAGIFDVEYDVEEDNTIQFPSDIEREKRKRDIH